MGEKRGVTIISLVGDDADDGDPFVHTTKSVEKGCDDGNNAEDGETGEEQARFLKEKFKERLRRQHEESLEKIRIPLNDKT